MSIESVMPSNHLILCRPLLLLPSIFPSIRVFSNESALRIRQPKYWSFRFNISPSNEHSGLISFRMDWSSADRLISFHMFLIPFSFKKMFLYPLICSSLCLISFFSNMGLIYVCYFSLLINCFVLSQQLDNIHVLQHFEPLESMYDFVVSSNV